MRSRNLKLVNCEMLMTRNCAIRESLNHHLISSGVVSFVFWPQLIGSQEVNVYNPDITTYKREKGQYGAYFKGQRNDMH